MSLKTGFIGAGNMAEAIAASIIREKISTPDSVFISDINDQRINLMKTKYSVEPCYSNHELIEKSEIIILAVKPQILKETIKESFKDTDFSKQRKLIISIAAGIKTETIENALYSFTDDSGAENFPVIRVMPNTPSLAGCGMSGISKGKNADDTDIEKTEKIMKSMGKTLITEEEKMDAVTAVSGSGPAYFFLFIESLVSAGIKLGFDKDQSFDLVLQTAKGAIALLEQTGETPEDLRRKVTSKGGTTEAALNTFMENNFKETILKSVKAAADRANELSRN
ncbi:MAG: pyrroline-5-carboxylate reductase [Thermodesulfobacteriota bacterium]